MVEKSFEFLDMSFESMSCCAYGFFIPLSREGRGDARIRTGAKQTACFFVLTGAFDALEKNVPSPLAGEGKGEGKTKVASAANTKTQNHDR
jgi:hypothetical protein